MSSSNMTTNTCSNNTDMTDSSCQNELLFQEDRNPSGNPSPVHSTEDDGLPETPSPAATKSNKFNIDFASKEEEVKFLDCMKRGKLNMREVCFLTRVILRHGKDRADLELLRETLIRYDSDDWKFYEHWDPDCKYTRNLIDSDEVNFTLMLLCWNTGKESPIHNHPQCECFVRCIQGVVKETRYAWPAPGTCPDQPLEVISSCTSKAGEVTLMNDTLGLHKITNAGDTGAVTLHLYFPPYQSCKLFLDSNGHESSSNVCFHSKYGHM